MQLNENALQLFILEKNNRNSSNNYFTLSHRTTRKMPIMLHTRQHMECDHATFASNHTFPRGPVAIPLSLIHELWAKFFF